MDFQESFEKLKSSDVFKDWIRTRDKSYLSHIFAMSDNLSTHQFGFYDAITDHITTFLVEVNSVVKEEEQEAFKEPGKVVEPLKFEDVKLHIVDVLDKVEEIRKQNYPTVGVFKKIIIIQTIDGVSVFNVTSMAMGYQALNIKVNTMNGDVVNHKLVSLVQQ